MGAIIVLAMLLACIGSLPYALGRSDSVQGAAHGARRFEAARSEHALMPPSWAPHAPDEQARRDELARAGQQSTRHVLGTDRLGRSIAVRCLLGGAISLGVGICAAAIAVVIGTLYGTIAAYCGGRIDAAMMRMVDVLYGLPNILLVVLLAVAVDGLAAGGQRSVEGSLDFGINRDVLNILTLLVAISAVSWLTMARVIRGQVLSLKEQPFMEACRAIGVPWHRQFFRHLLPNLLGPIIVYATLTLPTAILSESFLSFLGIGVQEPLPSWGNLAASGLSELNVVRMRWWLILWPCLFVAITLLALNFMGESLRERFDPKRQQIR